MKSLQRSKERGATLFVVVLAITLLTGVGLYSLHSSAMVARASGNQREARQSAYLAELGTLALLSETSPNAWTTVTTTLNPADGYPCKGNVGVPGKAQGQTNPPCGKKDGTLFTFPTGATLVASDTFGPYPDIAGNVNIEITDMYEGPPAVGFEDSPKGMRFYPAKFTTTAMLERAGGSTACVANEKAISGQHVTRAHVVLGPVQL